MRLSRAFAPAVWQALTSTDDIGALRWQSELLPRSDRLAHVITTDAAGCSLVASSTASLRSPVLGGRPES
eukprot:9519282-Prorocentrum_lima.AAC.1